MDEKIIVLSVSKPYSLTTENGIIIEGCTMWYLPTGDLKKTYDMESELIGVSPVKEKMGVSFHKLAKEIGLPCAANATYGMKNSGGKQILYVKGVDFIKDEEKVTKK